MLKVHILIYLLYLFKENKDDSFHVSHYDSIVQNFLTYIRSENIYRAFMLENNQILQFISSFADIYFSNINLLSVNYENFKEFQWR